MLPALSRALAGDLGALFWCQIASAGRATSTPHLGSRSALAIVNRIVNLAGENVPDELAKLDRIARAGYAFLCHGWSMPMPPAAFNPPSSPAEFKLYHYHR